MTSSARTEIPPKRFSSVFCAANAMAMPPMPRPASRVVRLKPRMKNAVRMATITTSADGMDAEALHREAAGAQQKPEKADANENADHPVVIKTCQQRQAEVGGNFEVSQRAE